MEKLRMLSRMTLMCAAVALVLTACEDKKKSDPQPTPDGFSLVGTWKYENGGTTENGTQKTSQVLVFNQDGTFKVTEIDDFKKADPEDIWYEDHHWETVVEGTYTQTATGANVKLTAQQVYDATEGKLVDNLEYQGYEGEYRFDVVGNAIVMESDMGGWLFYTKDGAKPAFGYDNHELVGTWKYEGIDHDYDANKAYIREDIYTFRADGSMEYINYQYRDPDTKEIVSGAQRHGYWALINNSAPGELAIAEATGFTLIDMNDYYWSMELKNYKLYTPRDGGHPMMYQIKDGKLYIGFWNTEEEYFYQYPLIKQ